MTPTQKAALKDLRYLGAVFVGRKADDFPYVKHYSRRTLQTLVDQGYAEWNDSDYRVDLIHQPEPTVGSRFD